MPQLDGLLFLANVLFLSLAFAAPAPPPRDPFKDIERVLVPLEREIEARRIAQGGPSQPVRVDLFTPDGKRIGYATVDRGRVDTFTPDGRRLGYGTLRGTVLELYDNNSNRIGSGRLK